MNREDVAMDNLVADLRIENINLKLAAKKADALFSEYGQHGHSEGWWHRVTAFLASQQGEQAIGKSGHYSDQEWVNTGCPPERPEQAEGAQGEREAFAAWWNHAAQWELRKSCAMGWGETVWRAARAALAQPSPDRQVVMKEICPACEHQFVSHHNGYINRLRAEQQPSPAPELERPEVVAFLLWPLKGSMAGQRFTGLGDIPSDANRERFGYEPLMTVAQHDRIAGALQEEASGWKALSIVAANGKDELRHKLEAAQARVAELEKQEPVGEVEYDNDCLWRVNGDPDTWCKLGDGAKLYAAPVAQAGQVPDVLFDGFAVYQALSDKAKGRTTSHHVSDTLDAVVKLMRAAAPAQGE